MTQQSYCPACNLGWSTHPSAFVVCGSYHQAMKAADEFRLEIEALEDSTAKLEVRVKELEMKVWTLEG